MDLLNMMDNPAVRLWLAQATVVFFIVAGLALLAVGAGLIANSAAALRFFDRMNCWVSMRGATRSLEVPHDTRQAAQKYRYWLAAIFVIGGIFALSGLLARYDAGAVLLALGLNGPRPGAAIWLIDAVRWILVVGNLAGIVVGLMLAFAPDRIAAIEARGSHWYSERKLTKGGDDMRNLKLDAWVAAYPRFAGWSIVVFALLLVGAFGFLLPAVF